MNLTVITGPSSIVALSDIPGATEQQIAALQQTFDGPHGWLKRCIGKTVLELTVDCWLRSYRLPYPPLIDVLSITYDAPDGPEVNIDRSEYKARNGSLYFNTGFALPTVANAPGSIRIRYEAGYETSNVPPQAKEALILLVQDRVSNFKPDPFIRSETVEDIGTLTYTDPDKISAATLLAAKNLLSGLELPRV